MIYSTAVSGAGFIMAVVALVSDVVHGPLVKKQIILIINTLINKAELVN